jgi:hypothetical protein
LRRIHLLRVIFCEHSIKLRAFGQIAATWDARAAGERRRQVLVP